MSVEWSVLAAWAGVVATWSGVLTNVVRGRRERQTEMDRKLGSPIQAVGVPPDLAPRKGRGLRLWPPENAGVLGPDARIIWDFASLVYPPRGNLLGEVSDHSFIRREYSKQFHEARGNLARFWNAWVPSMPMRYLRKRYAAQRDQLAMLAWLEIAVDQWTHDPGEGKVALIQLARALIRP